MVLKANYGGKRWTFKSAEEAKDTAVAGWGKKPGSGPGCTKMAVTGLDCVFCGHGRINTTHCGHYHLACFVMMYGVSTLTRSTLFMF